MSGKKRHVWYHPSETEEERRELDRRCQELRELLKDVPEKKNKPTLDVGFEVVHPNEPRRMTAFEQWLVQQQTANKGGGGSETD